MASLMLRAIPIPMAYRPNNCSSSMLQSEFISSSLPVVPVSVSIPSSSQTFPTIYCGRGDRKTPKGKRFAHSFGNARPKNKKKGRGPPRVPLPPGPTRRERFGDMGVELPESPDDDDDDEPVVQVDDEEEVFE